MDSLIIPDLDLLRLWLDRLEITFFECDSCQALHLPHMQNFDGILDAKIDLLDEIVLFSAVAEVKLTELLTLVSELSHINASSLVVKAFIDIQEDSLPKLITSLALNVGVGITLAQFAAFMRQGEEQLSMIVMETCANGLLLLEEEEKELNLSQSLIIH